MDFKKKQKFSIRKLTLGAASVLLGTSLVLGTAEAKAEEISTEVSKKSEEKVTINYVAVDEKDLTEIEKQLIIREDISKEQAKENDTYILVYKQTEQLKKVLPNTGISQNIINLILAGGLLVLVYRLGKKKSTLIGIAILTSISGLGLNNAQAEEVLRSIANQVKVHEKNSNLEKINIENYEYVGYIRDEKIPTNNRLKGLVESYKIGQEITKDNEGLKSEKEDDVITGLQSDKPKSEVPKTYPTVEEKPEFNVSKLEKPKEPEVEPAPQPDAPKSEVPKTYPTVEEKPEFDVSKLEKPKEPEVEPAPEPEEPKSEVPDSYPTVEEKPEFDVSKLETPKEPEVEPTPEESKSEVPNSYPTVEEKSEFDVSKLEKPKEPEVELAPQPEAPKSEVPNNYPTVEEKPEFDISKLEKPKEPEVEPAPQPEEPKSEVPNSYPTVEEKPTFEIPKSETSTREIPYGTTYVGDEEKEYGSTNEVIKPGVNGIETTTTSYGVTDSGEIIKNEPVVEVTQPALNQIEKVGIKPTVKTEEVPYKTKYVADTNADLGDDKVSEGVVGTKETKTTYELNTSTGEVKAVVGEPKLIKEPTNKVVTRGTKPKVVSTEVPYKTKYVADNDVALGVDKETGGVVGIKEIETTYELNKATGTVTPTVRDEREVLTPVNKVVTKGVKEVETVTKETIRKVYEKDNTREKGLANLETLGTAETKETTYISDVNPTTGELSNRRISTERVITQEVPTTIKVATKETVVTREKLPTLYQADDNKDYGYTNEVAGTDKETTTVYEWEIDPTTGEYTTKQVAPNGITVKDGTNTVVTKGTKPTVRTEEEHFTTRYEEDKNLDKGQKQEVTEGRNKVTTFTTTYKLDEKTGNVTVNPETSQVTTTMQEKVVKVGTKPTVRTEEEHFTTRYEADENLDKGQKQEVTEGRNKVTTFTTTYTLDEKIGNVTANQETSQVTTTMQEKVVKVGTKPTTSTTEIQKDDGKRYRRTTTTTYTINPSTGEITESAKHNDELIEEEKVKPTLVVTKVDTDDETKTATLTYSKTDKDGTFRKVTLKVYKDGKVVKELTNQTLDNLSVTLDNLDLYTKYQVETIVHYDLGKGENTESLTKREEVEIIPKRVEFRNVSSKELYKVSPDGSMSIVTGLTEAPSDKENYVVKLVNDGKEVVLPVASFTANGDKIDVNIEHPKLVTFKEATTTEDNYKFQVDKIQTGNGIYTTFNELISDMAKNDRDVYYLGSDIIATDSISTAYVNNFTKKLTSVEGKKYAIIGLKKPLINTLSGGTVDNIELRDVNITSNDSIGSVAITANNNSTISRVKTSGNINYKANSTSTKYFGGLVANLMNGSVANNNYVDFNIIVDGGDRHSIAGLVSRGLSSDINNNFVKSKINTRNVQSPTIGLLLANNYYSNLKNNIISGNDYILGNNSYSDATNKKIGDGSNGTITQEDANKKLKEWGVITDTPTNSNTNNTASQFDYSKAINYDASKVTAYRNTEKLLPLYDRNTVVKYGNLIASGSNLATKTVVSVTPMKEDKFIVNLLDKEQPNKLFIKYDDNTYEIIDLTKVGNFKDTDIVEYSFNNNLLFTLNQFNRNSDSVVSEVKAKLSSVAFTNDALRNTLKMQTNDNVNDLYLEKSFDEVKANLDTILPKLLSNNDITYLNNETIKKTIVKKVEDNKEKIMLGLSYLNRLYGINFDKFNIKDLVMFSPSFYGKNFDNIDYLIELGSQGFENLLIYNNVDTYNKVLSNKLGSSDLLKFLDDNRKLFTTKEANDWFRSSTKAFTHEVKSKVLPEENVETYTRLQKKNKFKSYILPLLNVKENDVYVVTTLSAIYFGNYGRSIDINLNKDSQEYKNKVKEVNEKIKSESIRWADYMDFYLKISENKEKDILKNKFVEVFDGYLVNDDVSGSIIQSAPYLGKRKWVTKYDKNYSPVYDFFGPIGRYYNSGGASARAERTDGKVYFEGVDILDLQGKETLNHELVHVFDEDLILQGYGYRSGQNVESYAYGILESETSTSSYAYGFNLMYDIVGGAHNNNVSRFQNKQDLQDYIKGVSDVTYLIDGLEAEIILSKSDAEKSKLLRKLEMIKVSDDKNRPEIKNNAIDSTRELSESEIKSMNLTKVEDLIDNNLLAKTSLMNGDFTRIVHENYHKVPLYYPIYAAYQNDTGTVGSLMFRRTAFDMLAEYGWDKGFVGYTSNKHKPSGFETTDTIVFNNILDPKYKGSYKEFKKDMFKKRLDQRNNFKPIVIKGKTIENSDQLKELLKEAIEQDLSKEYGKGFSRQNLKEEILRAFNAKTDNFRSSIFKS